MKQEESTSKNNTYKHCMAFKTEQTKGSTIKKTFQSNVDSRKYKMRMNFKQSGEIYTDELNKRQNYAGKTTRILITKT